MKRVTHPLTHFASLTNTSSASSCTHVTKVCAFPSCAPECVVKEQGIDNWVDLYGLVWELEALFVVFRPEVIMMERAGIEWCQSGSSFHPPVGANRPLVQTEEEAMAGTNGVAEDGTMPTWVSQLNALTTAHKAPAGKTPENMGSKAEGETTKKPTSSGLSRKRPGTGRKLPSIPNVNDSPVSSEHSSCVNDNSLDSFLAAGASTNGVTAARMENGHSGTGAQARGVTFSPVFVDTELLLRDTETVMAAMEARMGFRADKGEEDGNGSDTDLSSMVAMVNGDDDYVKPTKYHSPRESLTRKSSKDKDNSNIKIASRKPLIRSRSEQKPPPHRERSTASTRSGAAASVVSDVLSRNDSLDESFQSDVSSERGDASFSRSGSRGKGTITMTKPNRAFALRRARADGTEVAEASQNRRGSAASTVSSQASSRRSSSSHSTGRAPFSAGQASNRSEASLGAQIARKARDNAGGTQSSNSRDSPMTRTDGGRNSLRSGRTTTPSSTASSTSTATSAKKDRDLRTLKSQLKTAPGNKDLAITGVSSRSQSQPGSRSNSPKAAERLAWKRRKEYDPRKAVAQAKAKAKDPKPKPKAQSSLYKQRMIRSASFNNSVDLSGRVRHDTYSVDSTSSAEDLSSAATANDSYTEAGFRRAFIPFHNPLRSDRLSHSADEDEAGTFPTSQDVMSTISKSSSQPPVSLMLHKSAFTPPLSKLHTPSPDSPPPPGASLLLRRRTLGGGGVDYDDIGASTGGASSHRTQAESPQSYDSLIVSSIYQLSLKLKTATDRTLNKLREQDRVSITPSPIDDFLGHPAKSEIPAWKSANQELAGVLKNLRKMEHHLHVMERALFPDEDTDTDVSGMSSREKHKYFQEIERIRSELAGFQPIDTPRTESHDPGSPEMAELAQEFC
ncbi:hypothetical protein BaRGS_00036347 [Batillaria attramentaria]|uniref:Cep57 centrosome microtubule-binding domain-containing protein n=1 Tax=Batillaria attramentaria TaxID=370345 RepID=A0ABD0JBV1_9CAEN